MTCTEKINQICLVSLGYGYQYHDMINVFQISNFLFQSCISNLEYQMNLLSFGSIVITVLFVCFYNYDLVKS